MGDARSTTASAVGQRQQASSVTGARRCAESRSARRTMATTTTSSVGSCCRCSAVRCSSSAPDFESDALLACKRRRRPLEVGPRPRRPLEVSPSH
eukprot:6009619-Heterocapsa_arctica.AAC.1